MNKLVKLKYNLNINSSKYSAVLLLVLINVIVFVPVIVLHHSFLLDDYLIFTKIKQNIHSPISLNPSEEFFLFLRPLVYFYFWLNYNLWHTSAIGMKVTSLIFHLIYVTIFFLSILRLRNYLKLDIPNFVLLLIATAFSLYPDHLISIVWISNATELLSSLFYATSIYFVFVYLTAESDKKFLLYGYIIFFIFSILSKQQGLHLPFLILALLYLFKNRFSPNRFNKVLKFSFIGILLAILFSFLNYALYNNDIISFSGFLLKKPFSFIGITAYVFNPIIGAQLYSYFILHKTFALILLVILIIFILVIIRIKNIKSKYIFILLILISIIYYPRIFAEGGNRLNSLLIYWSYITLTLIVLLKYSKGIILFVIFLIFINLSSLTFVFNNNLNILKIQKEKIENLIKQKEKYNNELYVFISPDIVLLPYQMYFYKNNDFGKINLNYFPFHYRALVSYLDGIRDNKIDCSLSGNDIKVSVKMKNIFLKVDNREVNEIKSKYKILNTVESNEERIDTYKTLTVRLPEDFYSNYKLIFFDGESWKFIN